MRKLLPILLLLVGLGAGGGIGWVLKPQATHPPAVTAGHGEDSGHPAQADNPGHDTSDYQPAPAETETVRLPNQFVVPVIENGRVTSMVVIGLALDLAPGHDFNLSRDEPRLRAVFLQLLFDHANIGGFNGLFTSGEALLALRRTLIEAARREIGPAVHDVLITELLRQES